MIEVKNRRDSELKRFKPVKVTNSILEFTFKKNDPFMFYWDLIILILAIFNSVTIPLTLFFDDIGVEFEANTVYFTINLTATIFFILDIILNMNTTYYASDGEEIFNKALIRKNYFFGMFTVDLLSSLPVEYIFTVSITLMLTDIMLCN